MTLRLEIAAYVGLYLIFSWRGVLAGLLIRVAASYLLNLILARMAAAVERLAAAES